MTQEQIKTDREAVEKMVAQFDEQAGPDSKSLGQRYITDDDIPAMLHSLGRLVLRLVHVTGQDKDQS
jgi:hypothetical protein